MFLLCDEVLSYTMKSIYPMDFKEKIDRFKEEFFKTVGKQKSKIALYNATLTVNDFVAKEKIQEFDSVSAIEENLQRISTYNVQEVYEKKMSQIATIVNEKKYSELLIICNLKTEITRGVANRYLDSNYETKAVQQIQTNEELKKAIKKKYFK